MAKSASPRRKSPTKNATASRSGTAKTAAAKPATKPAAAKPASTARRKPAPAGANAPATQTKAEHGAHVDRVWELAGKIGICMFVTWDGERQRARPLAATVERKRRAIWFLTDAESHKDEQVEAFPIVTLAFADHGSASYLAITGTAQVLNDREQIRKLWSPFAKAWWDSPEDPAIRAIKVTPQDAELWDAPGGLLARVGMLAAAVTGRRPKIGDNAKVTL
jgi:general stress protein 26